MKLNKPVSVYLSAELKEKLAALAAAQKRTSSNMAFFILSEGVTHPERLTTNFFAPAV
jgi:predicted transcriptional regulator